MWGWTQKFRDPYWMLTLRLPGVRLDLAVPVVRLSRWRRRLLSSPDSRLVMRLLPAVAGLAVCLDLAKLGFVLVWLEIEGQWYAPPWLPEEVRVLGLTAAYVAGVLGVFYFAGQIRRILWPPMPGPRTPERRPPRPPDEPPETRHCGVPVRPRGPGPLVARCRRTAKPAGGRGLHGAHTLGHAPPCARS